MKLLKSLLIAATAVAISAPAFARDDESQAMKVLRAKNLAPAKHEREGLAGPTGVRGEVGPDTRRGSSIAEKESQAIKILRAKNLAPAR